MGKYLRHRSCCNAQMNLPLSFAVVAISDGLDIERASIFALSRRKIKKSLPTTELQISIEFSEKWKYRSRGTRRPAKYPFEMVEYARKLRGFGFFYREIVDEIRSKFRVTVPWITVRDWTLNFYRMSP